MSPSSSAIADAFLVRPHFRAKVLSCWRGFFSRYQQRYCCCIPCSQADWRSVIGPKRPARRLPFVAGVLSFLLVLWFLGSVVSVVLVSDVSLGSRPVYLLHSSRSTFLAFGFGWTANESRPRRVCRPFAGLRSHLASTENSLGPRGQSVAFP